MTANQDSGLANDLRDEKGHWLPGHSGFRGKRLSLEQRRRKSEWTKELWSRPDLREKMLAGARRGAIKGAERFKRLNGMYGPLARAQERRKIAELRNEYDFIALSNSACDAIAFKNGRIFLIELKLGKTLSQKKLTEIQSRARSYAGEAYVVIEE